MKIRTTSPKVKKNKTITFSELKRLSFCNSKDLPPKIILAGIVPKDLKRLGQFLVEIAEEKAREAKDEFDL